MPRRTQRRERPVPRRRLVRVGLAGLLVCLGASTRVATRGSGAPARGAELWRAGRPVPIAAPEGRARFTVPTPGPGARTLVVVSSLARSAGPFPVTLTARPIAPERVEEPDLAPGGPVRPPDLAVPPLPPVRPPVTTTPPGERTFHLMVRDGDVVSPSNYLAVRSTLRAVGERVQVYVDERDGAAVGPAVLRDLVATFDGRVFPVAARTFGPARDVDGDGRFTVLMSGWLARLGGGRHAVDGFVRGADLDAGLPAPFSNHCDMMYLSSTLGPGPHLRTVLAHEYTHAVTFTAKALAADPDGPSRPAAPEEEGWLDEALAHLVEDLHGFSRSNLDYRVSAFLSQPERYRLVVDDYYAADLFRSHGNRGGTYLFLRWCADRFGLALAPALIRSGRQGVANLEAATGRTFADLYRAWSLALFTTGLDPSRPDRDGFRSVDVRGPFDDWELAGPRAATVAPGGPDAAWSTAGTASRYLVVEPSPSGAVEVEVTAPPQAALQVSAVALPDDLAAVELSVRVEPGPDGAPRLRADLVERDGTPVRLSALAWEPLVPGPDPHAPVFRRAGLDAAGVAAAFGTDLLPARGRLGSRPIPMAGALPAVGGTLIVKAVGTDARGRRVAAWAEVEAGEREPSSRP